MDSTQAFANTGIIDLINSHIDWMAVLLVILGGLFAKKYGKSFKIDAALKTLLVGSVFITAYIALLGVSGGLHKEDYTKYFISYCFATTLYEILLKRLMKLIGIDKDPKDINPYL